MLLSSAFQSKGSAKTQREEGVSYNVLKSCMKYAKLAPRILRKQCYMIESVLILILISPGLSSQIDNHVSSSFS